MVITHEDHCVSTAALRTTQLRYVLQLSAERSVRIFSGRDAYIEMRGLRDHLGKLSAIGPRAALHGASRPSEQCDERRAILETRAAKDVRHQRLGDVRNPENVADLPVAWPDDELYDSRAVRIASAA